MKIYVAGDHAGFTLKEALKARLLVQGYEVEDCGAFSEIGGDDYPDLVTPCALKVANDKDSFGIIVGASGQGEAMAANRVSGVRAVVYYGEATRSQIDSEGNSLDMLESSRSHNNANILSLGARFLDEEQAKQAVSRFLSAPFSGDERHIRRIERLA